MTSISAGSGTPARAPREMVVVYSINQAFVLPCAVSLRSLTRSFERSDETAGYTLRVLVYHNDTIAADDFAALSQCVRSASRQIAFELRRFNYKIPPLLCDAPQWNNIETVATLLLPDLLRDRERAIFIDADTLIVGSIIELWNMDLDGRPCACVLDYDHKVPNTGLILYDLVEWNRRDLTAKCLHYVATNRTFHVDQEPFAAIPDAEFLELDLKWNYHGVDNWMYAKHGRNLPVADVRIVHFNGPPRPWYANCPRQYSAQWYRCLLETPFHAVSLPRLTQRHFLSFRISQIEKRVGEAVPRRKAYLIPYLLIRKVRMTYFYAIYWMSCRTFVLRPRTAASL